MRFIAVTDFYVQYIFAVRSFEITIVQCILLFKAKIFKKISRIVTKK